MPHILAQQMSQLTTWRVVVGGEVMMGPCEDTFPPTTTRHVASYDICCAKMCGIRLILLLLIDTRSKALVASCGICCIKMCDTRLILLWLIDTRSKADAKAKAKAKAKARAHQMSMLKT